MFLLFSAAFKSTRSIFLSVLCRDFACWETESCDDSCPCCPRQVSEITLPAFEAKDSILCEICVDEKTQLNRINPFLVAKAIDSMWGQVDKVEHMKSGSLLITTRNVQQIHKILQANTFTEKQILITSTVAWNTQISQGRIYAPEFLDCTLVELLQLLNPSNVIGIRNLYNDPKQENSPLYALTFPANKCPDRIRTGYSS